MRLFRINHLVQQVVEFFNAHFCLSEQRIIFSAPDLYKDLLHTFRHKHSKEQDIHIYCHMP